MTDAEIIKIARKCIGDWQCSSCEYSHYDFISQCLEAHLIGLLGIIDRQSAEIERLQERVAIQAADLQKGAL